MTQKTTSSKKAVSSTRGRKRVVFRAEARKGSEVSVVGDFNRWKPGVHMLKENGRAGSFSRQLYLPKGEYEYKFVIDGEWTADPECQAWKPNDFGTLNSVLVVE